MSIPTAADLAAMRADHQLLMPESWTLENPNENADDGQGGRTTVWETVTSGSAAAGTGARLMPAGYQAREQILAERPTAIGAWTITLPRGTAVEPQHRIVINGRNFYVSGIGGPHTWDTAVQVAAAEVQ